MHDSGGNRGQTVLALKMILPKLKKLGCDIITVDELLKMHRRYNDFHETKMEKKEEILLNKKYTRLKAILNQDCFFFIRSDSLLFIIQPLLNHHLTFLGFPFPS